MDSGILYWFLSRTRDRNANNIAFNGSTTFAQSNDIVAKTAYNGTVSGNVTIGSDGDGSYFDINGNKNGGSGTNANILFGNIMGLTQATNFEFHIKFALITNPPASSHSGIFGSNNDFTIGTFSTNRTIRLASKPTYSLYQTSTITLGVVYTVCVKYVASEGKAYLYLNGVLQNTGGSVMSTTFTCDAWSLGDLGCESTAQSSRKKVYYARVYSSALTDAQRTAELALGQKQTARKDCVLEILPDYFAGTTSLPTTIYDVKAFTPATPVILVATINKQTTSGTDNVVVTPFMAMQVDSTNAICKINQGGAKSSSYALGNNVTSTVVVSLEILNGLYVTAIYIDGVERDIDTHLGTVISNLLGSNYAFIGGGGAIFYFTGTISNVKVYIGTATASEKIAMSSGIPITPVNATLFTQPRRLPPYGTTMTDVSGNGYDFTLTP